MQKIHCWHDWDDFIGVLLLVFCILREIRFIVLRLVLINMSTFIFRSNSTEDGRDRCCIPKI